MTERFMRRDIRAELDERPAQERPVRIDLYSESAWLTLEEAHDLGDWLHMAAGHKLLMDLDAQPGSCSLDAAPPKAVMRIPEFASTCERCGKTFRTRRPPYFHVKHCRGKPEGAPPPPDPAAPGEAA